MLKRGFQFAPGYRLQEFLGRGQFGQVWRATAPGGTAAAVKFIDLSDGQGQKEYEAVKRVKQIRHANLMPITAIWLLDGQGQVIEEAPDLAIATLDLSSGPPNEDARPPENPAAVDPSWLVVAMLLGGKSLQARLRECTAEGLPGIPPKELISYMDEAAKGIDFLNSPQHNLGDGPIAIQHADVKPANIVLIGSSAVVCDFGLARILTRNQVTATSTSGTPAYMAPEAIAGRPSRTSDQYSLAVTYYHLRTGSLPVSDGSLWEVLDAHRLGNLRLDLVTPAEQQVLRKATDLDWEKRFEDNRQMVEALREALRSEGVTATSFTGPAGSSSDNAMLETRRDALATLATANDPTATVDTEKFLPQQTRAGGGESIDAEPSRGSDPRPGERWSDRLPPLLRRPPVAAGVAASALLVVVTFGMFAFNRDHDDDGLRPVGPDPLDPVVIASLPKDDPRTPRERSVALVSDAIEKYDTDEATAIEWFAAAAALDDGPLLIEATELRGHKGSVVMAEFADGNTLITVADEPIVWRLADSDTDATVLSGHSDAIASLSISPGGDRFVTAGYDRQPFLWDLRKQDFAESPTVLRGHQDAVVATAWHPREPMLVTVSNDPALGVWQLPESSDTSPEAKPQQARFPVTSLMRGGAAAFDSQGRWFATITDPIDADPAAIAFRWSELRKTLSVDSAPEPLTVTSGTRPRVVRFTAAPSETASLVVGDDDGAISLYSLSDNAELRDREIAHRSFVEAISVVTSDAGDVIVSGSSDGSVHRWQIGSSPSKRLRQLSNAPISSVDVSGDGRWIAAGGYDGSVWLWDAAASQISVVQLPAAAMVHTVRIDPHQKWLIAGCDDGVVRRWDLRWAKLIASISPM